MGQLENRALRGNPAGVVFLDAVRSDSWLLHVASEVNHSETAFLWRREADEFDLRWFTPEVEVDLCGHATLAAAHALWENGEASSEIAFHTRSGVLTASREDERVALDFPTQPTSVSPQNLQLLQILGLSNLHNPIAFLKAGDDVLLKVASGCTEKLRPDYAKLRDFSRQNGIRGVIVTELAPAGAPYDFLSRFFAPGVGVDEDPVTGSAHCSLASFWDTRFGNRAMTGFQASARGGLVYCQLQEKRVKLSGRAIITIRGELLIP